eukprot:bmy_07347T0
MASRSHLLKEPLIREKKLYLTILIILLIFPITPILNPTTTHLLVQCLYVISLHDTIYSKNDPLQPPPLTTQSTRRNPYRRLHSPCSHTTKARGLRHAANHINI